MMDTIQLEVGLPPWQPSSDAELVEVFVRNNMPVFGILKQAGNQYLFRCVEGFGDSTHVWVYAEISKAKAHYLRDRREHMWAALENVAITAPKTVALATDEDGILLAMDLKPEKGISLEESDVFVNFIVQYGSKTAKKGSKQEEAVYRLQDMISSI